MKKLIITIIIALLLLALLNIQRKTKKNPPNVIQKRQQNKSTNLRVNTILLDGNKIKNKEITASLLKSSNEDHGTKITKSQAVKIIKKIPYISLDQHDHLAEYFDGKVRVTFFSRKHPKNKVTLDEFEVIMDDQSGEILAAAAFFYSKDRIEKPDVASPISLEKAIEIAKREAQYEKFSKSLKLFKIRTEYIKGGLIRVIFLANTWDSKAKEPTRGPGFMASILIDAKTGKIVDYMVGR